MMVANDFEDVVGECFGRAVAMMEIKTGAVRVRRGGAIPALIVVATQDRDGGRGGLGREGIEKLFRGGAAGECVEGIAEPEQFARLVVGDERAEGGGDLRIAPVGEEISARAM